MIEILIFLFLKMSQLSEYLIKSIIYYIPLCFNNISKFGSLSLKNLKHVYSILVFIKCSIALRYTLTKSYESIFQVIGV